MRMLSLASAAMLAFVCSHAFAQGQAPYAMRRVAPAMAEHTNRTLFGDIWKRPGLSPRDRSLVTVAVLVATGKQAQLPTHVALALDNGVKPAELGALITQLAFYTGWPNAVSATDVADRVFRDRGITPPAGKTSSLSAAPNDAGGRAARIERTFGPSSPGLVQFTNGVLADLWRRSDLTPRDRSLVTIAALAANGDSDQLTAHYVRGIENGLSTMEIGEAMTHLAFYAGFPKAMSAIGEFARIPEGRSD